jgi:branched-chain amino acid transport system permease protein
MGFDWVYLIEVLLGGLMSGVMYSLVAIGFVLIYKSSGIFNFAQGTMLLFASLTFVKMTENGIDFWTALFIAAGVMVIFGVAIERYMMRPLANQDLLALFMATVGLATFQEGFSQFIWDSDIHGLQMNKFLDLQLLDSAPIFVVEHIPWLDILLPKFDIFASLVAGTLIVVLAFFFQKTKTGLSLRAVSDDHMAAMAVGIPLQTVWAIVWAVTGIIALVAGLLWAERVSVSFTLIEAVMKALPVILIGGLTSIPGAIIGGLVIGVGEKLGEIYLADAMGGQGIELWFAYFMALMFLVFRPQGMFGEKFIERV